MRATCAAAAGRVPVLAHVGRPGTAPTLELARRAIADGAEAISAVVPYYYPVGSDAIRAHYAALVEGLEGTPVYGYTIPDRTHNELDPALLPRLIGDGLSGLKDSTKSLERHAEYASAAAETGAPFELLIGTASLVLDALHGGSAGAVLAVANLHPELCVELARAFREGRHLDAGGLQEALAAAEQELQAGRHDPLAEARARGTPRRVWPHRPLPARHGRGAQVEGVAARRTDSAAGTSPPARIASDARRAVAGPVEMPHGPCPAATQSPSTPSIWPTIGRPSSDCGRAQVAHPAHLGARQSRQECGASRPRAWRPRLRGPAPRSERSSRARSRRPP